MNRFGTWIISGLLLSQSLFAKDWEQPADSIDESYNWKALQLLVWDGGPEDKDNYEYLLWQNQIAFDDRLLPPELHYLAASSLTLYAYWAGDFDKIRWICAETRPREDDYLYRARCLYANDMTPAERIRTLYELAELAYQANPHHIDGSLIYNFLANYLGKLNRNNESLRAYKRSIELIPPNAPDEIAEAKLNIAMVYTNSMFSDELKQQAIHYYQELIVYYGLQNGAYYTSQLKTTHYNLGIAYLFLYNDYESAIAHFKSAVGEDLLGIDALTFLAFAYAKSGQSAAARQVLENLDISKKADLSRSDFLFCYRDLALYLLGDKVTLKSCLKLDNPQADVLLNLTDTFYGLHILPADENIWWRMFYRSFKNNLLPDIQQAIASSSSEAELVKERAESRLKDLQLQNLELYQYLVGALAGLASLLGIGGFVVWKARASVQKQAARLQNVLDAIEEGIFLIHSDLTLIAEESQHLKNILGSHYRPSQSLAEFFALTQLSSDVIALQVACIQSAMNEDKLVWDLNLGNLVTDVCIGNKFLSLFWQPVFHRNRLQSIFLALRDTTDVQRLKEATDKAQADADKVLVYVRQFVKSNKRAVLNFLGDWPKRLKQLEEEIQSQQYQLAMRTAHSIKGASRGLGFQDLSEAVHKLEDQLQKADVEAIQVAFSGIQNIGRLLLAAQQFVLEGHHQPTMTTGILPIVSELREAIEQQLESAGLTLGGIHVYEAGRLTPSEYEKVRDILLHGLINALDHGFIIPARKGRTINVPEIAVAMRVDHGQRSLTIRDNGVGLAHDTLKALALARGWQPQPGETWSDFLFTDGVTTAESVTISSGRGVGLSAIRQAVKAMDGEVHLVDNDQTLGAMLTVSWQLPAKAA